MCSGLLLVAIATFGRASGLGVAVLAQGVGFVFVEFELAAFGVGMADGAGVFLAVGLLSSIPNPRPIETAN